VTLTSEVHGRADCIRKKWKGIVRLLIDGATWIEEETWAGSIADIQRIGIDPSVRGVPVESSAATMWLGSDVGVGTCQRPPVWYSADGEMSQART
jgi:hypothetical protein